MKIYSNGVFFDDLVFHKKAVIRNHLKKKLERSSIEFFLVYSSNTVVFLFARECKFLHSEKRLKDKNIRKRASAGKSTELFQTVALGFLVHVVTDTNVASYWILPPTILCLQM